MSINRQKDRTFVVAQWLRFHVSSAGGKSLFLVGELRSHMPCNMAKKLKFF